MKQLTAYSLALLLTAGTGQALAAGNSKHGGHPGHHNSGITKQWHGGGHGGGKHAYSHPRRHFKQHYRRNFNSHHGYYKPQPYHHYRRSFGYHKRHYSPILGAALVGSALNYSLYHQHGSTACYQDHSRDSYRGGQSRASEVVGCHRIEILPDGSERRVEVPLSACN